MTNLIFSNPGEIDIRGATIAGLSAKDSDSPIGFFGTGLKYAIASVLRMGGQVLIYSGQTLHSFEAEPIQFRGTDFHQVVMKTYPEGRFAGEAQPLGFTTEYGKTWLPWQVFRELFANAKDEGGDVTLIPIGDCTPAAGTTQVVVTCDELLIPYHERNSIILPQLTWQYADADGMLQLRKQPSRFIYYRGVRVAAADTCFTYDFKEQLDLTEDRTLKHRWTCQQRVGRALLACADEELISHFLQFGGDWEKEITFPDYYTPTAEFLTVAQRLFKQNPSKHERLRTILAEHKPSAVEPETVQLSPVREKMLARAIALCASMGLDPARADTIKVCDLGEETLGKYVRSSNIVYLDPKVFDQGTKQVVSTLYEELTHCITGHTDCNYAMQTHLFNTIISLWEEHILQEPF